ncbi:MAG: hypothetical protein IT559_03015 [Alphaproteobacteria bacterium]|nr:hypothetical protein [Alphaproteobacteria bacterium]
MANDAKTQQGDTDPFDPLAPYSQAGQFKMSQLSIEGGHFSGTSFSAQQEKEEGILEEKNKKDKESYIFAITIGELHENLEHELANLKKKIAENRIKIEEIDQKLEILEQQKAEEIEKITLKKQEKEQLELETDDLTKRHNHIKEKMDILEGKVAVADQKLMETLTTLSPKSKAAGEAILKIAQNRVIIDAKIKDDPDNPVHFHAVFQNDEGELYILHNSKGKIPLSDLESVNPKIKDLEQHARHQERFQNKTFFDGDNKADEATASEYYKQYVELLGHISKNHLTSDKGADIAQKLLDEHRELEGMLYEYHSLHKERDDIQLKIQENYERIKALELEINESTLTIQEIEEQKEKLSQQKSAIEEETLQHQKRINEIEQQLENIGTNINQEIEHQIAIIDGYKKLSTPENFYGKLIAERYAHQLPAHCTREEIENAAQSLDAALTDMNIARRAAEEVQKNLDLYESRHSQIINHYGDDISKINAATITVPNEKGEQQPIYRNDKTGELYIKGEDGQTSIITDIKAIAVLNRLAYVEGKLFANEAEYLKTGTSPPREMLSKQMLEEWGQTPLMLAAKNIADAAEHFETLSALAKNPKHEHEHEQKQAQDPSSQNPTRSENAGGLTKAFNNPTPLPVSPDNSLVLNNTNTVRIGG